MQTSTTYNSVFECNVYSCPTAIIWGHKLESLDSSDTLHIILQNPNDNKLNPLDMGDFKHSLNICNLLGVAPVLSM